MTTWYLNSPRGTRKDDPIKDIRKAIWNLRRELKRRTTGKTTP